jgi:hypothetical protein
VRRESSTVVALVGQVAGSLLAELSRSGNISVVRAPAAGANGADAGHSQQARPGWEPGAQAMQEAAHKRSTYVIVPDDPLAEVAARWRAMWQAGSGVAESAAFEASAADALAAWRAHRFELPDYYLVVAPAGRESAGHETAGHETAGQGTAAHGATGGETAEPDLYLGPLRAVRPHRVAVAGIAGSPAQGAALLNTLRSLQHGPWWPPLDELLDSARHFYAGGLTLPVPGDRVPR